MKQLQIQVSWTQLCQRATLFLAITFVSIHSFGQKSADWKLEQMPTDLETDFALSALPPHIRHEATVYLLDPEKGYYVAHQGSNSFICFVVRTEWEHAEFRQDLATPISYDAEGARTIFPVYADVEAMRASGKFTALQIKNIVTERFSKGIYKAPARPGISYMLGPLMRSYDGSSPTVINMCMPHYMFYAPYLNEADIGGNSTSGGPMVLGDGKSPHGYIILPVGVTEKEKIMDDSKPLLKRLAGYKNYFQVKPSGMHHQN
jgi:hypothetical protein